MLDIKQFENKNLICCECGGEFTWTAGEQLYFKSKGLHDVKRCPRCRKLRRETLAKPEAQS